MSLKYEPASEPQDFHVLSSVFEDRSTVNTSHVINHLSFGTDYPGPHMVHIRQSRSDSGLDMVHVRQSRPDMVHIRQSRPDSGLSFQVNPLKVFPA